MGRTVGEQPEELNRMRRRLDEFRRGTKPGEPFPGWVWAAAARLARRYGVNRTRHALGLEYNKLKRASGGATAATTAVDKRRRGITAAKAVKFVELGGALPLAGDCRLVLEGPGGQRLRLEMAPGVATEVILGLCRAGFGAQ